MKRLDVEKSIENNKIIKHVFEKQEYVDCHDGETVKFRPLPKQPAGVLVYYDGKTDHVCPYFNNTVFTLNPLFIDENSVVKLAKGSVGSTLDTRELPIQEAVGVFNRRNGGDRMVLGAISNQIIRVMEIQIFNEKTANNTNNSKKYPSGTIHINGTVLIPIFDEFYRLSKCRHKIDGKYYIKKESNGKHECVMCHTSFKEESR